LKLARSVRNPRAKYSREIREVPVETFDSVGTLVIHAFRKLESFWLWQGCDYQLIEARHAVGLSPKRDAARFREGFVDHAKQLFSIIGDSESLTFGSQPQSMPFVWRNSQIGALELFTPALDDAIEPDVILKGVGANHVVIVGVLESHNDASRLIEL
jgi:hypothetical protein